MKVCIRQNTEDIYSFSEYLKKSNIDISLTNKENKNLFSLLCNKWYVKIGTIKFFLQYKGDFNQKDK